MGSNHHDPLNRWSHTFITVFTQRRSPLDNIYHRFGSLRSTLTNLKQRFAARFHLPPVSFHHRYICSSPFGGSLPLAARDNASPFRLAPLAEHESSPPFTGSLPLAARE